MKPSASPSSRTINQADPMGFFVSWKDRKGLATALKEVYRATSADAAEQALTAFEAGPWGTRYPAIGQSWRRAWTGLFHSSRFPTRSAGSSTRPILSRR